MEFPKAHYDAVKNAVIVSGIFRSGTTILGKLVGSFKNAEYCFEPPLSFHLDYLLQEKKIDGKLAADLMRTYFAEDIMFNFHQGRGYNLRVGDDSCVFNMKSEEEVKGRWQNVKNTRDAIALMEKLQSRLVFKLAATYSIVPALFENFDGIKMIEIERNLKAVLSSVIAKKWFNDGELKARDYMGNWPFFEVRGGIKVPYFVKKELAEDWTKANEETRTVEALNCVVELRLEIQKKISKKYGRNLLIAKYEDLIEEPQKFAEKVAKFTGMEFSQKTREIIENIKPTKRAYDAEKLLSKCSAESRAVFLKNNMRLGYKN